MTKAPKIKAKRTAKRRTVKREAPKTKPARFRDQYARAIQRGIEAHPSWAKGLSTKKVDGRYTWYAAIKVRQDARGDVSDLTLVDVDKRLPPRIVTVALLGTVKSGVHRGELRRLTRQELERDFETLLANAIRRHGLIPVKGDFVRSVYRHESA